MAQSLPIKKVVCPICYEGLEEGAVMLIECGHVICGGCDEGLEEVKKIQYYKLTKRHIVQYPLFLAEHEDFEGQVLRNNVEKLQELAMASIDEHSLDKDERPQRLQQAYYCIVGQYAFGSICNVVEIVVIVSKLLMDS